MGSLEEPRSKFVGLLLLDGYIFGKPPNVKTWPTFSNIPPVIQIQPVSKGYKRDLLNICWVILSGPPFLLPPCNSDRFSPALPAQTTLQLIYSTHSSHSDAAEMQIIWHRCLTQNTPVNFHHTYNKTRTPCLHLRTLWLPPTSSLMFPLGSSCPLCCKHSSLLFYFYFSVNIFSNSCSRAFELAVFSAWNVLSTIYM